MRIPIYLQETVTDELSFKNIKHIKLWSFDWKGKTRKSKKSKIICIKPYLYNISVYDAAIINYTISNSTSTQTLKDWISFDYATFS